ncbi:tetratricopeptide repeat-containing sensor histidine kinase [Flavobacterium johnsoniae]|uniref:histidine kinase n=1 Tax=Flavobacterium johnsoniae (strain ATCC 17061 / DSM 2064 / JCM 8514 / BCRC 14874 / CCUG 350202 / NBRC 14942 / NCIMB 11054 / UW101) TaxID=376686 RepID=A5FMH3_FLAJ1|nr:sensor histidine kinase [Flavobacterium johnsoniae]ABQ03595.1 histidine kinase [Flavobacterium johnsoniae UW101]OXE96016.1 two-component sensor histidine kinase [Flavobacterium johnsoniae UW101]WQG79541.1 histidine kinase [Flavobacterium johnsoniae UW101]SHL96602.1 Signal transduction histidine kinase [Flavobacterium johnsoniae]
MKKIYLLALFLFLSAVSNSQVILSLDDDSVYIDSIANITKNTKSDSIKCLYSFKLSKLYLMIQDAKKSKEYLAQANSLKDKYPFLRDAGIFYNSSTFLEKGDVEGFEKTLLDGNEKLKKYFNTEAFRIRAIILQNYGIMQQRKNNEKVYMKLLINEAIPAAKKSRDYELISGLYKAVAIIFMNNNERGKASEYLSEAQKYIERAIKKSPTAAESKMETYIINAENLIELQHFYDAKKILDKAFSTLKDFPESNLNDSYYYSEGLYYAKQNKNSNALESYGKGIKSAEKHQNAIALNRLKFAEYEVLFKLKNYDKAKSNLDYLLENTPFVVDKKNYYNELAKVYNATKDYDKAYFYSHKYNALNDSLNNTKFQSEIVELEAKYKKAESEKKITLLQSQNDNAALQVNNNRLNSVLFAGLSFLLFLIVLFLWIFNKNQKKLSIQKEINLKQELSSFEDRHKLSVSKALIQGEEMERKRIARDLHDGLGSMLSGVKIHLNLAKKDNGEAVNNVDTLLDNSIKELRNISQNLMPESLLELSLEHALRDLCAANSNAVTKIEFQYLIKKSKLPKNYEIMIYRIIQELLNNALKYAKASQVLVSCSQNKDVFFITVEDDGVGFNLSEAKSKNGMGLKNIHNRVEFLSGKLEIDSKINQGTSVYIELNVINENQKNE